MYCKKLTIRLKLSLLAIVVFLALSSCENVWMKDLLKPRDKKDGPETPAVTYPTDPALAWNIEDFGPDATISNTFNVSNLTEWNDAKTAISGGGKDANYIINVIGNFTVPGSTDNTFGSADGIKVALRGAGRTLTLVSPGGSLIRTNANQTVILRDLTLQGNASNNTSLVNVGGGTFTMQGGTISGNTASGENIGGGVTVNGGTFTMHGGEISGNTAANFSSGGVVLMNGGTFTMHGGKIFGNTSTHSGGVRVDNGTFTMHGGKIFGNTATYSGGGVDVNAGATFIMQSGEISGNTAAGDEWLGGSGGGVYSLGTFTMDGGEISGNTASAKGGGVATNGGTFTMNGGEISGNTAADYGGGVVVDGPFNMYGGKISGNKAINENGGGYGGGVYVDDTFTMHGGEISGNDAGTGDGGGVYVNTGRTFRLVTGTIYGSTEAEGIRNTAASGASLYSAGTGAYRGTFNGTTWVQTPGGLLTTRNTTIRVLDGATVP